MRPLRILLSAYACEPGIGSEPGVGLHWALELAHLGHHVTVLTRSLGQKAMDVIVANEGLSNLRVVRVDLPTWLWPWNPRMRLEQLHYQIWQWWVLPTVLKLVRAERFDFIHHITFGVFRHHSLLAFMGVPFIFGPVGGGESAPKQFRSSLPKRCRRKEQIRDLLNVVCSKDPVLLAMYSSSQQILCKTPETLRFIPRRVLARARVCLELGIEMPAHEFRTRPKRKGLRLLYAGRLLYWKGIHLGIQAYAQLLRSDLDAQFTIVGDGSERGWLREIASQVGVLDRINWCGKVPQEQLMEMYEEHDLLLFPSLHDSSGNVVLESLSRGLPVLCLDLGGPPLLVTGDSGIVVRTRGLSEDEVINTLAEELLRLARKPELLREMRSHARARASALSWRNTVLRVYPYTAGAGTWSSQGNPL